VAHINTILSIIIRIINFYYSLTDFIFLYLAQPFVNDSRFSLKGKGILVLPFLSEATVV
jgi:hypothetical protein